MYICGRLVFIQAVLHTQYSWKDLQFTSEWLEDASKKLDTLVEILQ